MINCAALSETLLESDLFGHEKGAFTGATSRKLGKFEVADTGTLFLDKVGELPPPLQARLLRVLQERELERVGSTRPIAIDVRVVAATNRDLEQDVAAGRFRDDLFYRINVVPIELPALAERREDIALLAGHFLAGARDEAGRGPVRIAKAAMSALEAYPWPGNVRELENAIQHAVALCEGDVLDTGDLPAAVVRTARMDELRRATLSGRLAFEEAVADFERELLQEALEQSGGNQTRAAEQLRITRRSLKLKMDRYRLKPGP